MNRFYLKIKHQSRVLIRNLLFVFIKFIFIKVKFHYFSFFYVKGTDKSEIETTLNVLKKVDEFLSLNSSNDITQTIIHNIDCIWCADKEYKSPQSTWYENNVVEFKLDDNHSENFDYVLASLAMFSMAIAEMHSNYALPRDFHKINLPKIYEYIDLFSSNTEFNDDLKKYFMYCAAYRDSWRKNRDKTIARADAEAARHKEC